MNSTRYLAFIDGGLGSSNPSTKLLWGFILYNSVETNIVSMKIAIKICSKATSSIFAEIKALDLCLDEIIKLNIQQEVISIYSDSLYVVNKYNKKIFGKAHDKLWKSIFYKSSFLKNTIVNWIPGHKNNVGNLFIDLLLNFCKPMIPAI